MAKSELKKYSSEVSVTPDALAARFGALLQQHLQAWANDGFSLAEAIRGDGIDLCPGEWYWVQANKSGQDSLVYVSDDFYSYYAERTDFRWTDAA